MIEVEKKLKLDEEQKERLIKDAEFLGEKIFTDTYFDTSEYALTSKDNWLRNREGRFELKRAMHLGNRLVDQYDEIEDEQKISELLGLSIESGLAVALEAAGYLPFATVKTTRKKYKKDEFIIDLDIVDFGDSSYTLGEIETLVEDKSQVDDAVKRIMDFSNLHGLEVSPVRGKIIEYLHRKLPEHYQALVVAGVINEFNS